MLFSLLYISAMAAISHGSSWNSRFLEYAGSIGATCGIMFKLILTSKAKISVRALKLKPQDVNNTVCMWGKSNLY